jgi:glycosyltransferase involved in cell wall biosynthesis
MSTDDTADIAAAAGAKIINTESKNGMINVLDRIGFEAATGDWILRIDADERMTPSLAEKLLQIAGDRQYNGVRFARKHILFGKWVRHGGWFKNDQLRFFRSDSWDHSWRCEVLHSQVPVKGPILTLPANERLSVLHINYHTISQAFRHVLVDYANAEAVVLYGSGRRPSFLYTVFAFIKRFIGRYIIRLGFLDGWRGLILAFMLAAYDFSIQTQLWDLWRQQENALSPDVDGK